MGSLIILVPLALLLVALAVYLFLWAVDNEQFDDMDGPAHSILLDDEPSSRNNHHHKGES